MSTRSLPIIVIGTTNPGKLKYIVAAVMAKGLHKFFKMVTSAHQMFNGYTTPNPDETGKTYYANAHIKGRAWVEFARANPELNIAYVICDDSGLTVKALPDVMGVYSARLCSDIANATDEDRCNRLLSLMAGKADRRARYTAYLVLYSVKRDLLAEGSGSSPVSITDVLHDETPGNGTGCFGYDRVTAVLDESNPLNGTPIPHMDLPVRMEALHHRATALASIIAQLMKEAYAD